MGWTYELTETLHPEIMSVIESALMAPIKGGAFIAESLGSAAGYAVGLSDGERAAFDIRFTKQIVSQTYRSLLTRGKFNPIRRIIVLVLGHAEKSNPIKYAKEAGNLAIKMGVKKTSQTPFIEILADFIVARIIAKHAWKKATSKVITASIGLGLTAASIFDQSFYAAMRLKRKNHALYQKLYSNNLECFWFLVEKNLEGFV